MSNKYDISEDDLLNPGDAIPDNTPIYVINRSNSNKIFSDKSGKVMLTAPGTEGSVQSVTRDMLLQPGVLAMWTDGRIEVTISPKAQQVAVSNYVLKNKKANEHFADIKKLVKESEGDSVDSSVVTDVSGEAKDIVDRGNSSEQELETETVTAVSIDDKKDAPAPRRRRSRKTEDN